MSCSDNEDPSSSDNEDLLETMSKSDLRRACRECYYSDKGILKQLRRRLRGATIPYVKTELDVDGDGKQPPRKKQKNMNIGKHFVCPIALQLPWEPVTAPDGNVYERRVIEKRFKYNIVFTSPVTKKPMRKKLLPAAGYKHKIDAMAANGVVTGPLADEWNARKSIITDGRSFEESHRR